MGLRKFHSRQQIKNESLTVVSQPNLIIKPLFI